MNTYMYIGREFSVVSPPTLRRWVESRNPNLVGSGDTKTGRSGQKVEARKTE
jgi:hypothetical protein